MKTWTWSNLIEFLRSKDYPYFTPYSIWRCISCGNPIKGKNAIWIQKDNDCIINALCSNKCLIIESL